MADRVTERERVIVERDNDPEGRAGNALGVILGLALLLLALAFLFGWFNGDDANDAAPIEQQTETQVEVPAGGTEETQQPEAEPTPPPSDDEPTTSPDEGTTQP